MSQHYFHTTRKSEAVTVLLGWDRPLGHFFLVVERQDPQPEQDDYLYVNLDEPGAFDLDLDDLKTKLDELGIAVPGAMFQQVALDRERRVGNRMVTYSADGNFSG